MRGLKVFALCVGLVCSSQVEAYQGNQIPFSWDDLSNQYLVRNFTVDDGLPINSINYIAHHGDGYVYAATNDGLARFDGDRFFVFNTSNSKKMQSNRIKWVGSGNSNELWFLDISENLYLLKNGVVAWFQGEEKYKDLNVQKIDWFADGRVIITSNKGFLIQDNNGEWLQEAKAEIPIQNSFVLDGKSISFFNNKGYQNLYNGTVTQQISSADLLLKEDGIFNVIPTKDGMTWFLGNESELLRIDKKNNQTLYDYKELGKFRFWDLKELNSNELIISTKKGYLIFNRQTESFTKTSYVSESEPYFEDNAWAMVNDKLITKVGGSVFIEGEKVLESDKPIPFLTVDKEGGIWVATNGDGLYQIIQKKLITIGKEAYPGLENVYGIVEDGANIWIASYENNVFRINDSTITNWSVENSKLDYMFFRSVYVNNRGATYAGSYNLWEFEDDDWNLIPSFEPGYEQIDALYEDRNGRFWVGTDENLYTLYPEHREVFRDINGTGLTNVKTIQENKEELVVATVEDGIAILSKDHEFRFVTTQQGLSSNLIRDIFIASSDTFWVASEDRGLNRVVFNKEKEVVEVKVITTEDGLVDNSLHRIIKDQFGYFWINANKGIMRVYEKALNAFLDGTSNDAQVQIYGKRDGLLNVEGNGGVQSAGILTKDGKLLLPNQDGIVYTRPEWFLTDSERTLASPIFESINYRGSSQLLYGKESLILPKNVRDIQVKVTIPTFIEAQKMELEYRIDEVSEQWQKAGTDRLAIFTNLPAGYHTLRVRGRLEGGSKYSVSTIIIKVPAFFYETIWFIVLMAVVFIICLGWGLELILKRAKNTETKLNIIVNERTKELVLEKEKTEQALYRIQKLDKAKSQFFTNFTHELRTPLSLILNPIEDVLASEEVFHTKSESRDSLALVKRNAIRLKDLVNQLLDISKLNAGELKLKFELVDIVKLTKQVATQFEHAFSKKGIRLNISNSKDIPSLYIDSNAWNHVCTNLFGNALKFTPENGSISLDFTEVDNRMVAVTIKDSGVGISEQDLPFIFDTYYQGETSITKAGGTGIGLALVKGLVERMGGGISASSKEGVGTIFRIQLKVGKEHISPTDVIKIAQHTVNVKDLTLEEKPLLPKTKRAPKKKVKKKNIESKKVLLVEDNEDFRAYLSSVIGTDYNIEVATNGKEGLEVLASFNPDIIVSDIMMPEMDGYEMMKSIRGIEEYKNIPFIFLSAKDSAVDIEVGLNIGADIYLPKPVDNKVLLTQIKVLLRREENLRQNAQIKLNEAVPPLVRDVREIIQRHLGNPDLNIELIAEAITMSKPTLYRKWRGESDESINQAITRLRFEEAIKLIEEEGLSISEAIYSVGYKHLSYFSKAFKKMYGVPPQEYVKRKKSPKKEIPK